MYAGTFFHKNGIGELLIGGYSWNQVAEYLFIQPWEQVDLSKTELMHNAQKQSKTIHTKIFNKTELNST